MGDRRPSRCSHSARSVLFILAQLAILTRIQDVGRKTHQGALAEYVCVPATNIVRRPENVTPTQAAGILLAGQTAWQALFKNAQLEEGQHVFINGGSTAVGAFAIQFAKAKGLKVTATASAKNEDFVKKMGADEVGLRTTPAHAIC